MARTCQHIKEYEKERMRLKEEGYTKREKLGFTHISEICSITALLPTRLAENKNLNIILSTIPASNKKEKVTEEL